LEIRERTKILSKEYPKWVLLVREWILDVFRNYSVPRWMVFITDVFAAYLVFIFAYLLRFNFDFSQINQVFVLKQGLIVLSVYVILSLIFKSYSGLLRHTTLTDISLVFIVTTLSTGTLILITIGSRYFNFGDLFQIPFSILLIQYVSITVVLFFERVFVKILFRFATMYRKEQRNVLIYGAGDLAFVVKRVVLSDPKDGFNVVGFIDSDKNLQGKKINGIPVYDVSVLSSEFVAKKKIEHLILADKSISIEEKSRVIRSSVNLGIETLDTPEVDKWLYDQINARHFQKVRIEDLLGREPIALNMKLIKEGLHDRTIMITGAAGSIGSEIVRQLARFNSKRVILVDQAETPLFFLEKEIREKFVDLQFKVLVADVTNIEKMDIIFNTYKPEIIFHAAAYKHVSLMEENPHEAIRVNVGGTKVATELAIKHNVGKFVMISTDKSVNPTSVMGASKRICEKLVQSLSQSGTQSTQFIITRFGNVLGSNGSVIPLFSKQIQSGGPVTVTHPEIYRYFMTIPEACQLVLEAGFLGNGGEIFVFDMGDPVKILDLANQMILLSGLVPGKDIQIVFTGLRPGEKLYEELLTDNETTLPTHHSKIKKASVEEIDSKVAIAKIDSMLYSLYQLSSQEVTERIKDLVPEYTPGGGLSNSQGKISISEELG
jgi:FlaA1/EpsC-like NDP-sugar epimerase